MNRKLLGAGGLVIALALLLSVNVVAGAGLRSLRVDLTADKLFTLSEGSKAVLSKLDQPITLRLYFSEKLAKDYPPLPGYAQRVEELLGEYAARSGGHIRLEVLDPEPFSETEDDAVRHGLQGVPLPGGAGTLYFGLVGTNSVDGVERIPFFQPDKETFLEYDLTQLVYRLAHPERPLIGVLSNLPIEGQMFNPMSMAREMPQPWIFMDQVRKLYETRTLQSNLTSVPPEIQVLLVVHPKELPDGALYAIDQFVLRGGKLLAFVDPFCEADTPPSDPSNPMAAMMAPRSSTLGPLFAAWGVRLVDGQLAGDLAGALQVNAGGRGGRGEAISYVLWIQLGQAAFNEKEVVTEGLEVVNVATAGILEKVEGATTELTPLLQTSVESEQIPTTQIQFAPDPAKLLATYFSPDRPQLERRLTLAARLSGPVKSAFPGGKPAKPEPMEGESEPPPEETESAHLAESAGPINVIVVADCDMLADNWWARRINLGGLTMLSTSADNGALVSNALDVLGGSTELISLRGRGGSNRPFTVVEELKREAEAALRGEEQGLLDEQTRVEQRLNELLTKQGGSGSLLLTPEVEAEIAKLREEAVKTRTNLRRVRRDLNRDVESLGARLKWANVLAIPLLVVASAVGLSSARSRQRRSARERTPAGGGSR